MEAIDVLICARKLLKAKGFNKGYYATLNGERLHLDPKWNGELRRAQANRAETFCLGGALYGAGGGPRETRKAMEWITQKIGGKNIDEIPIWNDKPERTKEEVLNLLDELIGDNSCKL